MSLQLNTFDLFPKLPPELQQVIWEHALPYATKLDGKAIHRVIRIEAYWSANAVGTTDQARFRLRRMSDLKDDLFFSTSPEIFELGMTTACCSSRNVYLKAFTNSLPLRRRGRGLYLHISTIRFDDDTIIYIDNLRDFLHSLQRCECALYVPLPDWTKSLKNVAMSMNNLTTLSKEALVFLFIQMLFFIRMKTFSLIGEPWENEDLRSGLHILVEKLNQVRLHRAKAKSDDHLNTRTFDAPIIKYIEHSTT